MKINFCNKLLVIFCAVLFSSTSIAEQKTSPASNKATAKPANDLSKLLPSDKVSNAEIDTAFLKWSSAWMFDRYIPGSAHAVDRGFKNGTYVIRGTFDFIRSGTKLTIPFAAAYTEEKNQFKFSNLCYNDTSSGMTDCINPNDNNNLADRRAAAMQSRQFLGNIVLVGLVVALSENNREICVERTTVFGERYLECE